MAVLDIQRRGQQIGRLRIGQQVQAANGKMRPSRLDTFRFTTGSRTTADAIAALYGGEVRQWEREFEVITGKSEIGVTVPPRSGMRSGPPAAASAAATPSTSRSATARASARTLLTRPTPMRSPRRRWSVRGWRR